MSINAEKLVKFGPVHAEIFCKINADFCRLVPEVTETPSVISGIIGPIFTKTALNVTKILLFNTCKSEL